MVFHPLGRLVLRARVGIVVMWALLTIGAVVLVPSLASVTSSQEAGFLPAGSPSRLAAERLAAAFPDARSSATATLVFSRPGGTLTDADRRAIVATEAWLRGPDVPQALASVLVSVEGAADLPDYAAMYRSADGAVEMLSVRLSADPMGAPASDAVAALRTYLTGVSTGGLETSVTGNVAISSDYLASVIAGTDRTTLVTVILVVVILLLIYRAPVAAMVPLLTIGAAFAVARAVLVLLAMAGWQILRCSIRSSWCWSSGSVPTTRSSCSRDTGNSWAGGPRRRPPRPPWGASGPSSPRAPQRSSWV